MTLSRQFGILLDSLNADIREAFKDGLKPSEGGALIGAFTETMLKALPKDMRRTCWDAIVVGIERRFKEGKFNND